MTEFDFEAAASRAMAECVVKGKGENVAFYLVAELKKAYDAGVELGAAHLEADILPYYSEDIFLPVPDDKKAKNAVAADLLRRMLPVWIKSIRQLKGGKA